MRVWERGRGSAVFPWWVGALRGAACCRVLSSRARERWGEGLELPRALALGQLRARSEMRGPAWSWLLVAGLVAAWLGRARAESLPPDGERAAPLQLRGRLLSFPRRLSKYLPDNRRFVLFF